MYPNTRLVRPLRNGQVTLPAAFRHALRLDLASMLQITLEGDSLRIRAYNPMQLETGSDWLRELYHHFRLIRRESALSDEQDVNSFIDQAIATLRAKADVSRRS